MGKALVVGVETVWPKIEGVVVALDTGLSKTDPRAAELLVVAGDDVCPKIGAVVAIGVETTGLVCPKIEPVVIDADLPPKTEPAASVLLEVARDDTCPKIDLEVPVLETVFPTTVLTGAAADEGVVVETIDVVCPKID